VEGPPAAIIGWIPYFFTLGDMPANAWTAHSLGDAVERLFDSGNTPEPPANLIDYVGFRDFLLPRTFFAQGKKNFRGAACIRNFTVFFDEIGRPINRSYDCERHVGYTPCRTVVPVAPWRKKLTLFNEKGKSSYNVHEEVPGADSLTIRYQAGFRLGDLVNFMSSRITGQGAPFAWVELAYTIRNDASVSIAFSGSNIPSQRYYVDWSEVHRHPMLDLQANLIDNFIYAGADALAPPGPTYTWNGNGRRG
jgi:hypothetical protein